MRSSRSELAKEGNLDRPRLSRVCRGRGGPGEAAVWNKPSQGEIGLRMSLVVPCRTAAANYLTRPHTIQNTTPHDWKREARFREA